MIKGYFHLTLYFRAPKHLKYDLIFMPIYNPSYVLLCSLSTFLLLLNYKQVSEQIKHFGTQYKEDVYFFEENAKYVSSNILKISVILRVRSTS